MKNVIVTIFMALCLLPTYGNHNLEEQARCHFAFLSYNAREQCDLENVANLNPKRNLQKGKIASCYEMVNLSSTSSSPLGGMQKIFNGGMKFKNGDTLLARITPCLENGKAAYINCLNENEVAFGSTEYIVIESKGRIPSPFFYCLIRDSKFREFAIKNMNGSSGRQRVSAETIGKYQVPVLSDEDIKRFAKHVLPLFDMIRNNAMETQRLIQLRDSLLPKLMSGEIDVSKVEV